jgi:putative ABC transport system permease protein
MRFFEVIKTANSNLLRNKGRSFLTILAIFIGTFTIIMTTGINTGVNGYIDKQMESAGGENYLEIMPAGTMDLMSGSMMGGGEVKEYNPDKSSSTIETITAKDIEKIESISGIKSAKAYNSVDAEYVTIANSDKKFVIRVAGLPSNSINVDMSVGDIVNVDGDTPEIALAPGFSQAFGYDNDADMVGKTVKIAVKNLVTGEIDEIDAKVSGVQNKSVISMGRSWINEALLSKMVDAAMKGLPEQYRDRAYAATAEMEENLSGDDVQKIKDELKELGFSGMTVEDEVGMIKTFFDAITIVLTIFGGIALVAASIGIINTLYMAVQERTREIGLMKAMGLSKGKIRLMFSLEAVALGFWGAVVGIVLAFVAKEVANNLAAQTFLKDLPGFTLIEFNPLSLLCVALVIMAIAFLAGTLPARKASKLDPIESLRYE